MVYGRYRFMVRPASDGLEMVRVTQRQPDWTLRTKAEDWVARVIALNSQPKVEAKMALPTHNKAGEAYPPPSYLSFKPVCLIK